MLSRINGMQPNLFQSSARQLTLEVNCLTSRNTRAARAEIFWSAFARSPIGGLVHLEQFGVKQQRVGSLCVVVTLFVEVAQFVQVPGRKQQQYMGYKMSTLLNVTSMEAPFTLKLKQDRD